jgi:diacylglycerol kinase
MLKKFIPAFHGIRNLISDKNFIIHMVIAVLVVTAALIFSISPIEWLIIILCIGLVLTAESFNSAIETLCDLNKKEHNSEIRMIKDISAASVLISAIISAIAGLIIFVPEILELLG